VFFVSSLYRFKASSAFEMSDRVDGKSRSLSRKAYMVCSPLESPTTIYDLKTGSASLTPARIAEIQSHLPDGINVPSLGLGRNNENKRVSIIDKKDSSGISQFRRAGSVDATEYA